MPDENSEQDLESSGPFVEGSPVEGEGEPQDGEAPEGGPEPDPKPAARPGAKQRRKSKQEEPAMANDPSAMYVFTANRMSPKLMHYRGKLLRCENQAFQITGNFSQGEFEGLCHEHFGGGVTRWTKMTTERTKAGTLVTEGGGMFRFPGLPNPESIIADCYNGDLSSAEDLNPLLGAPGPNSLAAVPMSAAAPAQAPLTATPDPATEELRNPQVELKRMEMQQLLEGRRASLEEARGRAADQREERRKKERAERATMAGRPGFGRPVDRERSAFAFDGEESGAPDYSNQDAPRRSYPLAERSIGPRDLADILSRNSELQELRNELRELRTQKKDGPSDMTMMMTLIIEANKANAEILKSIAQTAQSNREASSERDMAMLRLVTDGNKTEKTMELLINAMGVREDKRGNEVATMLKLMEAGANLAGGKGFDDEPWWQSLLRGLGDAAGPLVGKMLQGQGAAQPVMRLPQPAAPVARKSTSAVPAPGQLESRVPNPESFAVRPPEAAPELAAAPARPALPQMEGASVVQSEEAEEPVSPEDEMREIVDAVLDDILEEAKKKPREAAWTSTVFELVPLAMLQKIAKATDYTALINSFQPYANVAKAARLLSLIKSDANMVPWLASGFESLQEQAQGEVAKYPVDESAPSLPMVESVDENKVELEAGETAAPDNLPEEPRQ